jgi:glycine dehydrogenase
MPYPFSDRHIGPSEAEVDRMLGIVGAPSLDALIDETIPAAILDRSPLGFGHGESEQATLARLRGLAARNRSMRSLIGQGYHGTVLPPVIQRNILENPAWYTAYTPYQPEISQGRLEALLNFQTLVCDLTGLDVANASLLDEATAAAEAMALARRSSTSRAEAFFVDQDCHPQTLAVLQTRAEPMGWRLVVGDPAQDLEPAEVFGALIQYPGSSGAVRDPRAAIAALHAAGAVVAVAADPLALTLLVPPGELGADIAVGSMQRFGVPMGYGGPHAAYMAVRDGLKRSMPGRIVGVSVDAGGRPAYRLALQTREQHIRREKATSNICTAQVLLAVIAAMYAVHNGPEGLKAIAIRVHHLARRLAGALEAGGFTLAAPAYFDTLTVETGAQTEAIHARALAAGLNLRRAGPDRIGVALDETCSPEVADAVWSAFTGKPPADAPPPRHAGLAIPARLHRTSPFLTHPVFHAHRSETEMLRYMRRLADKDLALDRTMIPLGSCTMKLNATAEMIPITWPEFADLHPFAPADQAQGYAALFEELEQRLCALSGYDAVSLQPNSGAQGEFAGLLAIRAYHRSRGEAGRNICLIPASAHGTNPASAQLAGMSVSVVACNSAGDVDLDDLRRRIDESGPALAAIMLTYPSTHGVFEEGVREICDLVHAGGGQVYLDGANLNAQVGLAKPGRYGADVSHFNLHKTFCIPHGGGGPGMGPIGVRAHLAPFLPERPEAGGAGAVSAAPYGSASILPIAYAYMRLMGDAGLRRASEIAILNANYVAARLEGAYPVLYRGVRGRVAHECIVDLRPIQAATGVTVEDVAKRLIDYGFHAPTMSFPVAGALMIEPTESEGLAELDRFCDAMIAIRAEIAAVERGADVATSPLRRAPHTALDLAGDGWDRPYSRMQACFPAAGQAAHKYWPPVSRIDNVHGDRNLVCSCPPLDAYREAAE